MCRLLLNSQRQVFMFPYPSGGVTVKGIVITTVIQLAIGGID